MLVRLGPFQRNFLELGQECAQLAFGGPIVQTFEVIGYILRARAFRKTNSFAVAHDADHPAFAFIREEKIEPHTEHQCDAQKGRQRGE